jgi:hypothetical protein
MTKFFLWGINEDTSEKFLYAIREAMQRATERFSYDAYLHKQPLGEEIAELYEVIEPTKLHYAPNLSEHIGSVREELSVNFSSLNIDTEPDEQLTPYHIAFSL